MILQSTTHWHTGSRKPPIVIIIASDTPRLNELIARVDDLLHSLSRLLELTLVLIAIVLAGVEVAVGVYNRLYDAYSGYKTIVGWYLSFNWLFWTPVRGIG